MRMWACVQIAEEDSQYIGSKGSHTSLTQTIATGFEQEELGKMYHQTIILTFLFPILTKTQ